MKYLSTLVLLSGLIILSNCNEEDQNPPGKPELVSPLHASTDTDFSLTFNWNPVNGAKSYGFQLSKSPDFTATDHSASGIEEVSISVDNLMPSAKYYWRVNAKNSSGISPWSEVWELTTKSVGIPLLISPVNNSIINQNQTALQWNSVAEADGYSIQVSITSDFASTVLNKENHTGLNINLSNLDWNTKYYWRIRASINACNSEWSEMWNFTPKRPIPSTGLVAYYPFNGNANDESGNSHNGIVYGSSLASDRHGNANKAYFFDGINDYISVSHHEALNLIGNFSISVWFRSEGCAAPCDPPAYHTIIMKRDVSAGPGDDWPWGLSISYIPGGSGTEFRKLYGTRRSSGVGDYKWSTNEIEINTWEHAVIVIQGNTQSIYINNQLDSSSDFALSQVPNSKNLNIGWSLRPGMEQFKGLIDDIRLYSRALTTEEILALFEE